MMYKLMNVLIALVLAAGLCLACSPSQEDGEMPARPGENPPGYEQKTAPFQQEPPAQSPEGSPAPGFGPDAQQQQSPPGGYTP